jgi:uncharacterized protein (TIGR02996 family)
MKISDYPDLISDDDESSFLIAADWLEEQGRDYEARYLREGHAFGLWFYFLDVSFNYTLDHGDGYGEGVGYGDGDGYGDGSGYGNGDGYGSGYGAGYSAGYGAGYGSAKFLLMFFASIS